MKLINTIQNHFIIFSIWYHLPFSLTAIRSLTYAFFFLSPSTMSSTNTNNSTSSTNNNNNGCSFMVGTNTVTVLNTQHSLKLKSTNYPAGNVQMNALFIGYDLKGFIDGTKLCPTQTDPEFNYWTRQDQLILHAIIISVDQSIITALGNVKTSQQAWDTLKKMFASKTRSCIMHLKERLSRTTKGSKSVSEYLQGIKSISDELAVINKPVDDDDLVIHALNGLGSEYKEVSAALRTCENPIAFAELHDLLVDYENVLQRDDESAPVLTAHAAYRGKHAAPKRGYAQTLHLLFTQQICFTRPV